MIEELIFETLAQRRVELAAKTVAAQFRAVATIALDKSVLKPADESAAREHLVLEASRAVLQVNEIFGESRVKGALQDQLARIDACLSERKVLSALALLPAKLVATAVAKMCGAPDPRAMMRSLSSNFSPNDFQAIRELRAAVTVENRANDAPPTVVTAPPSELLLVAREQMAVRLPAFRMLRANALTDEQILSAVRESPDLKAAAVKLAGKQVASETIQDHRHSPVNVIRSQLGLAPLL
jgi:hypothetical protein